MDTQIMEGDKGGYRQINESLNICVFDEYLKSQTANLPPLPDVEQLTPRVMRVLGQNPGRFTLQGTNTYIVGTGTRRLIIDTGGGEERWAEIIKATLDTKNIVISHVLITHFHGDHSGGVSHLKTMYPHLQDAVYKNEPERGQQPIHDNDIFAVEGATIRAHHFPGHSTDHMCFTLEEEQAMFTGDNILGHGTSAIEDLWVFMGSLTRMRDQHCGVGYSAHGCTITDLPGKITSELSTKFRREQQVLKALRQIGSRGERGAVVGVIVSEIYGNLLDEQTRAMALEPFIEEVLRKLAADGSVAFEKKAGLKKWFFIEQRFRGNTSSS